MKIRAATLFSALCAVYILFAAAPFNCALAQQTKDYTMLRAIKWPRDIENLHTVAVFTKFKGEAPGDSTAPDWAEQLFSGEPGSVPHFFRTTSLGQYSVTGEYLPKRYELPRDSTAYVKNRKLYTADVLQLLEDDPDVDLSQFDNEGPDGVPASADDDGFVDYLILMPMSRPYDFIMQLATGVYSLGINETFISSSRNYIGEYIKVDKYSGCIAQAKSLNEARGVIIAEIAHAYGAIDMMDVQWNNPGSDSAGAGYWDLLGKGALGWDERDGPAGFSALNRVLMNSAGVNNANLVDLYGLHQNVRIRDVSDPGGKIYRFWINSDEFFLVEYRRNNGNGSYYDRNIPKSGLLIWHVYLKATNSNEFEKVADLECADGRWLEGGFPLGETPAPETGGDNLDFWAHDNLYSSRHQGNCGDATDVYDGVYFTKFGSNTNPNSDSKVDGKSSGLEIFNIRAEGDEMVFDCIVPPFHNWFEEQYPFIGSAFHRFSVTGSPTAKPVGRDAVYMLKYGASAKPSALVSIVSDTVYIEDVESIDSAHADLVAQARLMDGETHRRSKIVRRNISLAEFLEISGKAGIDAHDYHDGGLLPTSVLEMTSYTDEEVAPYEIELHQNFPNPFNAETTISYTLPTGGPVTLEIFNIAGQRVSEINLGHQTPGMHTYQLNGDNLASGVYLYRLDTGHVSPSQRFTLIK